MEGIEEILQAIVDFEVDPVPFIEGQVLAMDDRTSGSEDEALLLPTMATPKIDLAEFLTFRTYPLSMLKRFKLKTYWILMICMHQFSPRLAM